MSLDRGENRSNIAAILKREEEVRVNGMTFLLSLPTAVGALDVRRKMLSVAGKQDDLAASGIAIIEAAAIALRACMPDSFEEDDEDTAIRLVLATGGEGGELSKAALRMCGFDMPEPTVEARPEDPLPI